jgi:hypothetical protein
MDKENVHTGKIQQSQHMEGRGKRISRSTFESSWAAKREPALKRIKR